MLPIKFFIFLICLLLLTGSKNKLVEVSELVCILKIVRQQIFLLKHADDAMYSAKNQGKNNYVVFKK